MIVPLRISDLGAFPNVIIEDGVGNLILQTIGGNDRDTAEQIVVAANAYAPLRAALEQLIERYNDLDQFICADRGSGPWTEDEIIVNSRRVLSE